LGNLIIKTKKRREVRNSKPHETKKIIVERKTVTDEDIRRRAYEISLENGDAPFDATDNWLCAARELNRYYE
jgi:Protein of unknown function (DUF2934)